jgi:hypothetical protein
VSAAAPSPAVRLSGRSFGFSPPPVYGIFPAAPYGFLSKVVAGSPALPNFLPSPAQPCLSCLPRPTPLISLDCLRVSAQ